MPVFSALHIFVDALGEARLDEASPQIQSIELRQAIATAMPALTQAGLVQRLAASGKQSGEGLIAAFFVDLEMLGNTVPARPLANHAS